MCDVILWNMTYLHFHSFCKILFSIHNVELFKWRHKFLSLSFLIKFKWRHKLFSLSCSNSNDVTSYSFPQPTDDQHGRIHKSPDTMVHLEDLSNIDHSLFYEGGGGGGGATFIFRVRKTRWLAKSLKCEDHSCKKNNNIETGISTDSWMAYYTKK